MLYNHYLNTLETIALFVHITNVKEADEWVTPDLLSLIRQQDRLKEEVDSYTDTQKYPEKLKEFRVKRNEVKIMVINAKLNYVSMRLHSNADDPRKYWVELNCVMPTGKK